VATYIDLPALKNFLGIAADDNSDDTLLTICIDAAEAAIDRKANRHFAQVALSEARLFTARWDADRSAYVVQIDDLMDDTGMTVTSAGTAITETPMKLPLNAAQKAMPWTKLVFKDSSLSEDEGDIEITALWGWDETPAGIKAAALIQASRFYKRKDAIFGVAGSPEMGSELRLLEKLDSDVGVLVGTFKRFWAAA
jgi:hypothetical protein